MSLLNDYRDKCATCGHYGLGSEAKLKNGCFYCHQKGEYYSLDDSCPGRLFGGYSYNPRVTEKMIGNALEMIEKSQKSGCYITTAICEILNYSDDCQYLTTLRTFRNNVLQNNNEHSGLLVEYDTVGPYISASLKYDIEREMIARILMDFYIEKICDLINNNDFQSAITLYNVMTKFLIQRYHLANYHINGYEDTCLTETGHGRVRVEKKEY